MLKKSLSTAFLLLLLNISISYAAPPIIIYSGITMAPPLILIAKKFERKHCVSIRILQDASGVLYKKLLKNRNVDIFFPGSDSYLKKMKKDYPNLIGEQVYVGHNRAALFVKKGNPKNIPLRLESLLNKKYDVILGSPQTGSIGKITKVILERKGIYKEVIESASITSHSKSLMNALRQNKADLTINWYAVSSRPEYKGRVEAKFLDKKYAKDQKLAMAQINDSRQPEVVKKFLKFVGSDEGLTIFRNWGF